MLYKILFLIITFALNSALFADNITVINHTTNPVWVGVYKVKASWLGTSIGDADLQNKIVKIPADGKTEFDRPRVKLKINREVFFSDVEKDLKNKFNNYEYKLINKIPAGTTKGSTFHIAEKDGVIKGYHEIEWKVVKPIIEALRKITKPIRDSFAKGPHGKETAVVRRGSNLAPEEVAFLHKRESKVKNALEKLLKIKLDGKKIPKIALCMSGGGMRAATVATGVFEGLESTGLLDATTYVAALSGSTWTVASIVELGQSTQDYCKHFTESLTSLHAFNLADAIHVLQPKVLSNQQIGPVDLYGMLLAATFFHHKKNKYGSHDIQLSDSQRRIKDGNLFFPIYTALQVKDSNLHCAEFTPYEFGIDDWNMHIPIWSFGRKFVNGTSTDFATEQSLGFLMGIWGSALSGSIKNIINTAKSTLPNVIFKALNDISVEIGVSSIRAAAIKAYNPLYAVKDSPFKNWEQITLMDAGYVNIFPFHPIFNKEREIGIIIFVDASGSVFKGTPDFKEVVKYTQANRIPFPQITFDFLTKNQVNLFSDKKNANVPIVIYLAPVKNKKFNSSYDPKKEYPSTFKFIYTPEEIKNLKGVMRQNIIDHKDKIIDAIRQKIEQIS
ncbi:MAG: hypothetical protein US49_C0003G0047 [candidate division TM6 bacterium GW2011_GWF2_37_49]|nr:MAG: hypothetical protein US49_C0003G0047 [candidate division TM6 bacterium GW2011_GWF2_37_49]